MNDDACANEGGVLFRGGNDAIRRMLPFPPHSPGAIEDILRTTTRFAFFKICRQKILLKIPKARSKHPEVEHPHIVYTFRRRRPPAETAPSVPPGAAGHWGQRLRLLRGHGPGPQHLGPPAGCAARLDPGRPGHEEGVHRGPRRPGVYVETAAITTRKYRLNGRASPNTPFGPHSSRDLHNR